MRRIHLTLILVGLFAQLAWADDHSELLRSAGDDLGQYYRNVLALQRSPTSSDALRSPDDCLAAVTAWKSKGVKTSDRIFSYDFNQHPKAKDNTIPLSEMPAVCEQYRPLYARYKAVFDLTTYAGTLMKIRDGFVKPGDSVLTDHLITEYETLGDAAACRSAAKTAVDLDTKLKVQGAGSVGAVAVADFETKVCDELAKLVPTFVADARAKLKEHMKEVLAPYVAAGIAGDKLDLIGKYEGVEWRLTGGKVTSDPAALAKAAVIFQWLEAEDREDARYVIHTIRKYQFKGNTLAGTSEKQYRRKKGADVGNVFR